MRRWRSSANTAKRSIQEVKEFSNKFLAQMLSLIGVSVPEYAFEISDLVPLQWKVDFCDRFLPEFRSRAEAALGDASAEGQSRHMGRRDSATVRAGRPHLGAAGVSTRMPRHVPSRMCSRCSDECLRTPSSHGHSNAHASQRTRKDVYNEGASEGSRLALTAERWPSGLRRTLGKRV